MNSLILAMATFAFVGAVTPGPVNLLATSTAVNHGIRAAATHVVGASVAYAVVVFISGSIMQTIVTVLPKLEMVMKFAGSFFLCYLAYKIYTAPISSVEASGNARSGLLTVIGQENERLALIVFTLVSLLICLLGISVWAMVGRILADYLENSTKQRQFNRVMAGLLGISVTMIWI